jgi:puromycin-sensitive aminopeptidase
MFDVLTYQKGGSVLRMLEQFLGAEVFRDGIRDYLRTHAYANTETADLWDALERSSGRAVRSIMTTWIDQGGYPLVRVGEDGSLRQSPFSYRGEPGGAIGSSWQVPILTRDLARRDGASEAILLEGPALRGEGSDTRLVNAGGSGYYRVSYPAATVERLAGVFGELAPLERYNLVSDTWAAALAGQAPLGDLLGLARAMADGAEGDPSVWSVVIGAFGLFDRVVGDADRPTLAGATRSLLSPLESSLGWEPRADDGERTPALRASVLRTLGTIGDDPATKAEASKRFAASASSALHPDTESAVLEIVASDGGSEEYDAFLERYRNPANPQQEMRYLYALGGFDDAALAARTFELAVTEVRTQNAPFLLQALLANRITGAASWARVEERWDELIERFPANTLPRMLDGVRALCTPPSLADEVTRFVEAHPLPAGGKTVEQTLERLAVNVAFGAREAGGLAGQLRDRVGVSPA